MTQRRLGLLFIVLFLICPRQGGAAILSSKLACEPNERWALSGLAPADQEVFVQSLIDESILPIAIARAEQLTVRTPDRTFKLFGEYWKSRVLFQAGLPHLAITGFNSIVEHDVVPDAIGVQLAALECVLHIQGKLRRIDFTVGGGQGVSRIAEYVFRVSKNARVRQVVALALVERALQQISKDGGATAASNGLVALQAEPVFHAFAKGMVSAALQNHADTISSLEAYFKAPRMPEPLKRYQDSARISLARAYVAMKQDAKAIPHFQKVRKESNEVVQSLLELSWLYLKQQKHQEAIGVTYNIFSSYRHAFSPGTLMLMAMALNELCQYPGALKTVAIFRSDYRKIFDWLKAWAAAPRPLYPVALAQLEKKLPKEQAVPAPVFTEWMRSPVFVALQREINLIQDEKAGLVRALRRLKSLDADALAAFPPLKETAARLSAWFLNLYRGMPKMEAGIVKLIEEEFGRKNQMMLSRMNDISENIHLIEVEIFNGASEDVVWRNLHPDYNQFVDEAKAVEQKGMGQRVWSWGTVVSSEGGAPEVWEDELGTLRANLSNNCSNRDRYAEVKLK